MYKAKCSHPLIHVAKKHILFLIAYSINQVTVHDHNYLSTSISYPYANNSQGDKESGYQITRKISMGIKVDICK
jgi:hypothetical protein